jgi:ElaB/YqjD/DUF883 family membrane-anchored ribosome-binding protein
MQLPEQPIEYAAGTSPTPTLDELLSDVDEFLSYIAIVKTPEVDAVRDRLEQSLSSAKDELLAAVERSRLRSPRPRPTGFVRVHPWTAIAAAAVLGAVIGTMIGINDHRAR